MDLKYLFVSRLANPNLQWEKTTSWNVGLDVGFFNNRINASMEYYVMPTTDMIMNQYNPQIQKSGETKTKGSKSGKNPEKSQFQAVIEI